MSKPEVKIAVVDGVETLSIDFNGKGVTMPMPVDPETVRIAGKALVESLAGTSEADIAIAVYQTLIAQDA